MTSEPLSPDDELRALHARRRRARLRSLGVLALACVGLAGVWWLRQPVPEPPERALFARVLPKWSLDKLNHRDDALRRRTMLEAAAPWPAVQARLAEVAAAYGAARPEFKASVAALNASVRDAGLPFWVDAPFVGGKQWVLTYDELGRHGWSLAGGVAVEVLRVRRLDRVNLEMHFLGHADGDRPVVLADRVEAELVDLVLRAYTTEGRRPGEVEEAARGAWRSVMQELAGAEALAEAAALLKERALRLSRLSFGAPGNFRVDAPDRIELGDEFLDSLEEYADLRRPGGALILSPNLRALRETDRALRRGEPRRALEMILESMMLDTEAHEARHVLEPLPDGVVPPKVVELAGSDDMPFAERAARELQAYLGQLHASERPCTSLAQFAFRAFGDRAGATPHHYASRVLLQAVSTAPGTPLTRSRLAGDLLELCRAPTGELRAKVAAAHQEIFGTPFVPAVRAAAVGNVADSR